MYCVSALATAVPYEFIRFIDHTKTAHCQMVRYGKYIKNDGNIKFIDNSELKSIKNPPSGYVAHAG